MEGWGERWESRWDLCTSGPNLEESCKTFSPLSREKAAAFVAGVGLEPGSSCRPRPRGARVLATVAAFQTHTRSSHSQLARAPPPGAVGSSPAAKAVPGCGATAHALCEAGGAA